MATASMSSFLRRLSRGMAAATLQDQSDRQLVERLLAGRDDAVFETIVRRHGAMVYRVCWRVLQQEQDTEDAFQATFLILAQKLCTVQRHASLASWLHGIAHRVALKARAQAATRRRHDQKAATEKFPPEELPWRDLRAVLDAELVQLPEKWRLPLILCYLEGRTQDEAAKQLGLSNRTLRRRLEEARVALGRRLTRCGVVWPAALAAVLLSDCVASAAPAARLVCSTVEAAAQVAAGLAAAGIISAKVAALTEGVMKTMLLTKLKTMTALVLVLGMIAFGAGLVTRNTSDAAPQAQEKKALPEFALDLTKIDRTICKEPAYRTKPRYGLLVLGPKAETRIWLVIDDQTLYVDHNGNGDLTEQGEQVAVTKVDENQYVEFHAGQIVEVDGKTKHSNLIVCQYYARQYDHFVNTVSVMDVKGTVGQGVSGENDCSFGATPKDAPIIHINGPLTMKLHSVWVKSRAGKKLYEYSEELKELVDAFPSDEGVANKVGRRLNEVPYRLRAGESIAELHVQLGTPGLGKGTFAAFGTQRGFPADLHPMAEINMPSKTDSKETINLLLSLKERCCGTQFHGPVQVPEAGGQGKAKVTLSFLDWKQGKVAPAVVELPMIGALNPEK
jgi:RNA polymerase sigma factor (sigma-70 family)